MFNNYKHVKIGLSNYLNIRKKFKELEKSRPPKFVLPVEQITDSNQKADNFYAENEARYKPPKIEFLESMQNNFTQKFIEEISKKFDKELENHLKSCLKKMGFEFKTQTELINFCIERVQRIIRGNQHTFYLDYVDNETKGIIIGGYNSSIIFSMEGFTAKSNIDYRFF